MRTQRKNVEESNLRYGDLVDSKIDLYSPFMEHLEKTATEGSMRTGLSKAVCLDNLVGVLIGRVVGLYEDGQGKSFLCGPLDALGESYTKYLIAKGILSSPEEVEEAYKRNLENLHGDHGIQNC